jgi:CRISPR-associated protein Cmr5
MTQSRDQKRSKLVFDHISKHENVLWKKRYGAWAHTLPVLIRSAGLAQAVAFLDVKAKSEGPKQLRDDLQSVLRGLGVLAQDKTLRDEAHGLKLLAYVQLSRETLGVLTWFKRFADSVLGVRQGEGDVQD